MRFSHIFRQGRRPRVLLAWEIGAGLTHAQCAAGIATHLAANGADCLFAAADPRCETWFRGAGCPVLQTYLWPPMRTGAAVPAPRDPADLLDILADYGLIDPVNLAAGIAHYDALFELARPDLLLCDNAFAALLAARGRIPAIVYGSTLMFMPPATGDGLAPIDPERATRAWPEDEVLGAVNAALGASARPPLSCAADLMDCSGVMPFGPAAFDPYAHARIDPVLAPYCPDLPRTGVANDRSEIFVYLHESAQFSEAIMAMLEGLPPPVRAYIPALTRENAAVLERCGVTIERRMLSLDVVAQKARCLVHHGGVTLTAAALALGVPQFILARFHDNAAAGAFVAERNLGGWIWSEEAVPDRAAAAVRRIIDDAAFAARAESKMGDFRGWFGADPSFAVAQRAGALVGLREMKPARPPAFRELATI